MPETNNQIDFDFEIYEPGVLSAIFGNNSYYNRQTNKIGIYYHDTIPPDLAFRAVVFDVNHECLHTILTKLLDHNTSHAYDNIALNLESSLRPEILTLVKVINRQVRR